MPRARSGGEIKRAEILQLLAQNPDLVLIDEPGSGVDLESIALIGKAINRLLKRDIRLRERREIPQEVGDFGILLHSGYPKRKALSLNILSSLSTIPGAIVAYYALEAIHTAIPYAMAFSAASFL